MEFNKLERTFIVAEIGVNHEGNEETAAALIDMAAESNADAVKFQTYEADTYVSSVQAERRDRVRRFQLSREVFGRLAERARSRGLVFFSTPLAPADADFLDEIAPIFKISSGDLTYVDLIRHVASKGKPIIVSTALGTEGEIEAAVDAVLEVRPDARESGSLMLMHCVGSYPTDAADANLRNILWLKEHFGLPVGYSDHTLGIKACELAVAMGAVALEKHFTLHRSGQTFHDHLLSAEPGEMRELVAAARTAERYLGRYERIRSSAEEDGLSHLRRSLAAAVDIPVGVPVKREWVTMLRPAWGLPPEGLPRVVGHALTRPVSAGDLIHSEDVVV